MNKTVTPGEILGRALEGDRPSCQPRRFQTEGVLLGNVPAGPRAEWRIYRCRGKVFVGQWQRDPYTDKTDRWVPRPPTEYGFISCTAEVRASLWGSV